MLGSSFRTLGAILVSLFFFFLFFSQRSRPAVHHIIIRSLGGKTNDFFKIHLHLRVKYVCLWASNPGGAVQAKIKIRWTNFVPSMHLKTVRTGWRLHQRAHCHKQTTNEQTQQLFIVNQSLYIHLFYFLFCYRQVK